MRFKALALSLVCLSSAAFAAETPVGKHQILNGMEIGAVYLQPVTMDMTGMMLDAAKSDIHLEADIHAVKGNPNGFSEGDWIPYLMIDYVLEKVGGKKQTGHMMPMVASDGPHYGDNVKLQGPGKYKLTLNIQPQSYNTGAMFGRHIDKETGVGPWFKPFELHYEFAFAGIGKKGGY